MNYIKKHISYPHLSKLPADVVASTPTIKYADLMKTNPSTIEHTIDSFYCPGTLRVHKSSEWPINIPCIRSFP